MGPCACLQALQGVGQQGCRQQATAAGLWAQCLRLVAAVEPVGSVMMLWLPMSSSTEQQLLHSDAAFMQPASCRKPVTLVPYMLCGWPPVRHHIWGCF
jgi:hypothetical protein